MLWPLKRKHNGTPARRRCVGDIKICLQVFFLTIFCQRLRLSSGPSSSGFTKTLRACQFFHAYYISTSQLSLFNFYSLLLASAFVKINHQAIQKCIPISNLIIRTGCISTIFFIFFNTFAASYLNTQGLNNSCLKSPASTLVDLTFQSRALRSYSLNQLRNLSL